MHIPISESLQFHLNIYKTFSNKYKMIFLYLINRDKYRKTVLDKIQGPGCDLES